MQIGFCRHCEACHRQILDCPLKDGAAALLDEMLSSDGILFATPNYINQVTASLKALMERAAHFIHCLRLLNKHTAAAVSSGSGQDKSVLAYIHYYSNICGAYYSGGTSSRVPLAKDKLKVAFQLGRRFASEIKGKITFPEQTKAINKHKDHFRKVIEARRQDWAD